MTTLTHSTAGDEPRGRYEVRVRGVLSPALLRYLQVTDATTVVARHTIVRAYVSSVLELSDIFASVAAHGIEVIDIRNCKRPGA